ncbi:ATP-grasp domain-containing protein [Mesobacillus zeae]|uniref:ATP-grasp domain-containing protein n=1 Tax=Mesobacillus zeae TaxID=1917180 RepID=A0A398AZQ5_9BACI|nr:ATP-grasp domain-containing protein [Mesobacillus zeae]RID82148.1 ATP-grasp domain-containing protein [Mesobacillus zeae]
MQKNVLVFPCGSEIGLEIHNSLKFVKGIKLFGASSVSDHGKYLYSNYIEGIPNVEDPSFIEAINNMIEKFKIDFIFPAHDSVVLKLAQNKDVLKAEVVTSSMEVCETCRSKKKTYEYFDGEAFVPFMYEKAEDVEEFPVFLKPDVGQGSKGIALAKNREELVFHLDKNDGLLILEYLPGKEFTIDCFTDRHGELKFAGMRERRRIKSGISVNSYTMDMEPEVFQIAKKINEKMDLQGMWFFQVKEANNGSFKLMEIAPRIAGTMSLYRNKGINFSQLSIYDRLGFDINVISNNFDIEIDRALMNRFSIDISYDKVYIDFDDTITLSGKVNPYIMMFIYQCHYKDIEVVLITKHIHDIEETLRKLKVDRGLFEEIVHIQQDDEKHKYFKLEKSSIFIDDSYSERKKIHEKFGIPVFDIDAIESLIDWRN